MNRNSFDNVNGNKDVTFLECEYLFSATVRETHLRKRKEKVGKFNFSVIMIVVSIPN